MLAASQRPAGPKVGMSALMGEQGTHAFALCSGLKMRPKSNMSKSGAEQRAMAERKHFFGINFTLKGKLFPEINLL